MSININRILREKYRVAGRQPRASGRRPRFTPEQAAQLIAERQAGRSIMWMAREHRTSQSFIAKYVREGFQPARWTA
jgi:hypothetical protein